MLDTRKEFANIETDWTVPAALSYFRGHFPGQPTFPAVGIVDASLDLIRKQSGNPRLYLSGVHSAKFTAVIVPEQKVHIELTQSSPLEWQVEWTDANAREKKFASLRLNVAEE